MADKGKIIIINDGTGGIVEDSKTKTQVPFTQPNHKELCLNIGDRVKYDPITTKDGKLQAINVERITAGVVLTLDGTGGGTLEERQTQKKVPFYQPLTAEAGIDVGVVVRYSLICTKNGELAVNLAEVVE